MRGHERIDDILRGQHPGFPAPPTPATPRAPPMPVPAPAVTFVTALPSRPAPLSPQRFAPPPDARHPRCPDRLNRPKPGRGLAEATEQPRATTGYRSLW